ncbi:MAG: deoxyribodipyrimidine photo-lyase [Lacibacter sp.]
MSLQKVNICWFRRDLRLHDHAALYHALKNGLPVVPVFVFDKMILDQLEDHNDKRVDFIHQALSAMQEQLAALGSSLEVYTGTPLEMFQHLCSKYRIDHVYTNHDYEPYAKERDDAVRFYLNKENVAFHTYKDQVVFEKDEVLKDDGKPYTVFTPYSKKWKATLNEFYLKSYPTEKYFDHFFKQSPVPVPTLQQIGFEKASIQFEVPVIHDELIRKYKEQRDIPSANGTTRLSVHLRFGTISIRELARHTSNISETFLNELIWRDFYHMILWHFPQVGSGKSFRAEYDFIQWRNNEHEFQNWCDGETGYPIVDAGMRELNSTGFMHNRVRMIVASFLTKHLLVDWRWGEAYFAKKLLDFDFAANNGGWQWASGSGCDAAPYFRIFNPYLQTMKFDPELKYIRKWVPEFEGFNYPKPIVEHDFARKRCLQVYADVLKK